MDEDKYGFATGIDEYSTPHGPRQGMSLQPNENRLRGLSIQELMGHPDHDVKQDILDAIARLRFNKRLQSPSVDQMYGAPQMSDPRTVQLLNYMRPIDESDPREL